jgi:hypothetical protein
MSARELLTTIIADLGFDDLFTVTKNDIVYKGSKTPVRWDSYLHNNKKCLTAWNKVRAKFIPKMINDATKLSGCHHCIDVSSGSDNLTSDLDVSIIGCRQEMVAVQFLIMFQESFGEITTAEVFDSNIYAVLDFALAKRGLVHCDHGFECKYLKSTPKLLATSIMIPAVVQQQHKWALAKVLSFAPPDFVDILYTNLPEHTHSIISHAIAIVEKYHDLKHSSIFDQNVAYADALLDVFEARNKLPKKPSPRLLLNYREKQSFASFMSQEAYWTEGSQMHVLLDLQGRLKGESVHIEKYQYLDSVLENFGDALKTILHHPKENVSATLIDASKYISRAADAESKGHIVNHIELHRVAENVRSKVRGKHSATSREGKIAARNLAKQLSLPAKYTETDIVDKILIMIVDALHVAL